MRNLFFNRERRLRNGWWMLLFIAVVFATRFAYTPLSHALRDLGIGKPWLEPLAFAFILLATWVCTRLRREPLASVGFRLDRRWAKEAAWGTALGMGSMALVVALMWASGAVRLQLDPARSLGAMGTGLYVFVFVALFEETLFRGFLFQRLVDGAGVWVAQIALAVLFAAAHWGNPDMQGATRVWASLDIALGALMLGMAYLRTRSLALPFGLHLGWNWMQGHVLGFDVSGVDLPGWFLPQLLDRPAWMTGGAFGPESTVFAVAVDLAVLALLWKWQGSAAAPTRAPALRVQTA
ncbi:CPBP family intramembrane glutamic endopeptidase [Lysobacter solisilvae (ex Woo and Kim 2020)]|uniref:CPBP family intramembrane metalloprotease n=1 Tax=Agrilutibacter terrestris TaxID=2865112 RepID=A0A7H0G088_9GAMM|nr:type II CAAX endopeptidase family protein [Lysobacter terrestris]QNP41704.1 CPBP family intramembrane metalloprotease [Lysobacter terrestris]